MREQFLSNRLGFSWRTALIGIVVIKAVLSLAVKPGSFVVSYSGISYFLLLLLATSFATRNGIQKTLGSRPFWVFLAIAYGLWGLDQWLYLYYELGLHIAVPDNSIADTLLFFHIVPLMAAVASLPHRKVPDRKQHPAILNSLLILFFWVFLYGYIVFPHQYLYSTSSYGLRFDILYLLENLVLISAVGILTLRTQAPWKSIYVHLIGASTLYALSSAVANLAIDSGGYVNGKLYGLGMTASVCWFAWIPLQARQVAGDEVTAGRSDASHGSRSSVWAVVIVVMICIPIVWELLQRNENPGLRTLRLVVALATLVCLASTAYITEYFARRELASHIGLANEALRSSEERLRLAQRGAGLGTFERDVRTGRITWSEGLESLYGLPPGSFDGKTTAFFKELIHSTDYEQAVRLIENASKTGQPTEGEWRAIWPDGSVHWIAGRWQVLMDASGEPWRVVGVNMDITGRKRVEEALLEMNRTLEAQGSLLRSQEELLRVFVKNVPASVAMLDRDMHYLQVSDRWCSDYLPGRAQILGRSHYEIFPDMPERWKEVHRRALEGETLRADEDRWDGQDGTHWARWEVRPWKTAEGAVGGILILAEDITRRKQMEEALSALSRKLIESQEQERARIGRELHDDINQRLAMVSLELEQLQHDPSELQKRVEELRKQMSEISNDVQALSHDLHSSKLEYLGVAAGMKSWCKEFSERQKLEIDFRSEVPSALPLEVGLSLFRVLQEALNNAIKHSGVKRVEVQLREDSGEIHLVISDIGRGFDVETALQGKGLGLTSMRERVRLVNGTIAIDSKPNGGTTIRVRLPLGSEQKTQRAAG